MRLKTQEPVRHQFNQDVSEKREERKEKKERKKGKKPQFSHSGFSFKSSTHNIKAEMWKQSVHVVISVA